MVTKTLGSEALWREMSYDASELMNRKTFSLKDLILQSLTSQLPSEYSQLLPPSGHSDQVSLVAEITTHQVTALAGILS